MAFDKRPPKKDIRKEVIRILRPVPPDDSRGVEIAIVRFITDGTSYAPQLMLQEVYTDRLTKKRMHGKVKGLKWGDFNFLTETPERRQEILDLLRESYGRTKHAEPSGQEAASNDYVRDAGFSADEEAPF